MQYIGIKIRVKGKVQGVGFRPFIWQLAQQFQLNGNVSNDSEGVLIHLSLTTEQLPLFLDALQAHCPPLAEITDIQTSSYTWLSEPNEFTIIASQHGDMDTLIVPDAATCPACLHELTDPNNTRYHYPFINCTHCGPRFTIIFAMPYDRPLTAMRNFPLCPPCQQEYGDPANRRFHAQPTACAKCGPSIWLTTTHQEQPLARDEQALQQACEALLNGKILAIKGVGGFHLVCDATNHQAVMTLRERKKRPTKPFAIMLPTHHELPQFTPSPVPAKVIEMLESAAAPIVLIEKTTSTQLSDAVAPHLNEIGVMLPSNPLHHLIMQTVNRPLIMTSGNLNGLPPAITNQQAVTELASIADLFLLHNRDILQRADDSLLRVSQTQTEMLRRSRGYVPNTLNLPDGFQPQKTILALGADLKNTFCLLQHDRLIISQHFGDLHQQRVPEQWQQGIAFFNQVYQATPEIVAYDAHPHYFSHQFAKHYHQQHQIIGQPIWHHHAHIAACLAEHGWGYDQGDVIALTLDGLGYGKNQQLWGGECLKANYHNFTHLSGLPAVALPGGDLAAHQPWRNLLAHLSAFVPNWQDYPESTIITQQQWQPLQQAITKNINSPKASSCGRLFDAIAAALGCCADIQSWEGEAACQLEALAFNAENQPHPVTLPLLIDVHDHAELDFVTFWQQWLSFHASTSHKAWAFHDALSQGLSSLARHYAQHENLATIVLTGGVLHNRLMRRLLTEYLHDFIVLVPESLPAGDGAISLGQAIICAALQQQASH